MLDILGMDVNAETQPCVLNDVFYLSDFDGGLRLHLVCYMMGFTFQAAAALLHLCVLNDGFYLSGKSARHSMLQVSDCTERLATS
jgi:hypothetical protein